MNKNFQALLLITFATVLISLGIYSTFTTFFTSAFSKAHRKALLRESITQKMKDAGVQEVHIAACRGDIDSLIRLKDKIYAKAQGDILPVHCAAGKGKLETLKWLIKQDKRFLTLPSSKGLQVIHHAAYKGNLDSVKWLASQGVKLTTQTDDRSTPLTLAITSEKINVIQWLLAQGVEVNVKKKRPFGPMHIAARNGNLSLFKILVEAGGSINDRTNQEGTPAHFAASNGCIEILEYLIEHPDYKNYKDRGGNTPLDVARELKQVKAIAFLEK